MSVHRESLKRRFSVYFSLLPMKFLHTARNFSSSVDVCNHFPRCRSFRSLLQSLLFLFISWRCFLFSSVFFSPYAREIIPLGRNEAMLLTAILLQDGVERRGRGRGRLYTCCETCARAESFKRIWPIKRGLRAALSTGLTQSRELYPPNPSFAYVYLYSISAIQCHQQRHIDVECRGC